MKLEEWRGDWALVTGASAGIGWEFCRQLAARGINLVLVARREERLRDLAEQVGKEFGVRALVVVEDLATEGAAERIRCRVDAEGLRLRLLVNNAAFGRWGEFEGCTAERYRAMLDVNVVALVELTHALLPRLASAAPAAVINVASAAAYQPVPYMAVYAASKAFVMSFSQALHAEWRERGVLVQTLVPGPTESEFDQVAEAYASAITGRGPAQAVVQDSMRALEADEIVALNARGTFKQRLFAALFPPRFVVAQVAKMFRPPGGSGQ